jgi:MoaA/NifB/PqqE/SkfB family radical SAM enzyme
MKDKNAERLLRSFFRKTPQNKIQNVLGIKRVIVDILMAGGVARKNIAHIWKDILGIKKSNYDAYLSNFRHLKYVYFNGGVFLDCFSPRYPGEAWLRVASNSVKVFAADPRNWEAFTIALIISITKKCVYRCEHCYAVQTLGSKDVLSYDELLKIGQGFADLGIGVIAWEGGEPLLRFEELLNLIRNTTPKTDAWIATTAYGLTMEQARKLRQAGLNAAIISLDHWIPEKHNKFRKNKKAFDMAVNGVKIFRNAGILPNICICATKEVMDDPDGLWEYLELAKKIGVGFIQILDATPSGNYLDADVALTNKQIRQIQKFHIEVNTDTKYKDYPSVSARALLEHDSHYGCTAGNSLVYVDNEGRLQPCDLLQIAFGNVVEEGVEKVYHRMKKFFPHYIAGRCPAQTLHKKIHEVYTEHQSVPVPYEKCPHILEMIKKRGLPKKLRQPGGRALTLIKTMLEPKENL